MTGVPELSEEPKRRLKNLAMLAGLAAFAILFYFITIVRFGTH